MTLSPDSLPVEFLDPPPGLRKPLPCSVFWHQDRSGNPSLQTLEPSKNAGFPPAWLLPPPTPFSATGKTRFNPQ